MTDTPPDRLAATPGSPYYNEELLTRGVGVRFNGVEKTNVEEYCVSEGWVRLAAGTATREALVTISLTLTGSNGQSVTLHQQAHVSNEQ